MILRKYRKINSDWYIQKAREEFRTCTLCEKERLEWSAVVTDLMIPKDVKGIGKFLKVSK